MCLRNFVAAVRSLSLSLSVTRARALFAASCRDCLQNGCRPGTTDSRSFPRNKRDHVTSFVRGARLKQCYLFLPSVDVSSRPNLFERSDRRREAVTETLPERGNDVRLGDI